jgi:hypothetical protein
MNSMALVFTTMALFIVTLVASWIFYQRIKMAQSEYEDSKESVRNIAFSFTRQVQRLETDIDNLERDTNQARYIANEAIKSTQESYKNTDASLRKIQDVEGRIDKIESSLDGLRREVKKISEEPRPVIIPNNIEVDAPIPVNEENIFKELTDTELEVLRLIVDMREGTVPEIRENIDKTREHTARLLKKLYDQGFIDRNTSSMPYRYYIRPEIKDILLSTSEQKTLRR